MISNHHTQLSISEERLMKRLERTRRYGKLGKIVMLVFMIGGLFQVLFAFAQLKSNTDLAMDLLLDGVLFFAFASAVYSYISDLITTSSVIDKLKDAHSRD